MVPRKWCIELFTLLELGSSSYRSRTLLASVVSVEVVLCGARLGCSRLLVRRLVKVDLSPFSMHLQCLMKQLRVGRLEVAVLVDIM